jgi:cytochrome P450
MLGIDPPNTPGPLLAAGLDTTANMLALGTLALLSNPSQLAVLHANPEQAVEELLRYLSIAHTGVRAALVDVELDGQLIKAGESTGHLSFGHGIHQCLGQQLARVEMQVALPALFARFRTLRLAVAPEEVPMRDTRIYGVQRLPVTWDVP